jgi:2,4-dienoyl-CoA reductase (NADPH2)
LRKWNGILAYTESRREADPCQGLIPGTLRRARKILMWEIKIIQVSQPRPWIPSIKESQSFAAELEKAGVDAFDVSIGLQTVRKASPTRRAKMGTFVYLAEAIKKSVSVPVMAVGRINVPEVAESILAEGRADLIGIARQLVTDPYWPKKVMEGRTEEIIPCNSCNACFKPMLNGTWKPGDRICVVNKRAGREIDT